MAPNEADRFMDSSITHLSENNKSFPFCPVYKAPMCTVTIEQRPPALSGGLSQPLSDGLQQVGGRSSVDSQVLEGLIMKNCLNPLILWRVKAGPMPEWIIDVWWHLVWGNVAKSFSCSEEQRTLQSSFRSWFKNKYVNVPVTQLLWLKELLGRTKVRD